MLNLRSFRGALSCTSRVNMVNKDCVLVTECARPSYCGFWVPSCASRLVSNNCRVDPAIMACISWLLSLSCGLVADFQPGADWSNNLNLRCLKLGYSTDTNGYVASWLLGTQNQAVNIYNMEWLPSEPPPRDKEINSYILLKSDAREVEVRFCNSRLARGVEFRMLWSSE